MRGERQDTGHRGKKRERQRCSVGEVSELSAWCWGANGLARGSSTLTGALMKMVRLKQ